MEAKASTRRMVEEERRIRMNRQAGEIILAVIVGLALLATGIDFVLVAVEKLRR